MEFFNVCLAGSRWRRVPVEYASTSEDEYGSNRHASKQTHVMPFHSTRVAQLGGSAPATPNPALKPHSREQDEYMRDWTAHSEEIARYIEVTSVHITMSHDFDTQTEEHWCVHRQSACFLLIFFSQSLVAQSLLLTAISYVFIEQNQPGPSQRPSYACQRDS